MALSCYFFVIFFGFNTISGNPLMFSPLEAPTLKDGLAGRDPQADPIALMWSRFTKVPVTPNCVATTSFGASAKMCGVEMVTVKGRPISAFLGIKYAEAERFLPPKPSGKYWTEETLKAIRHGAACPQIDVKTQKIVGQEDCLYLNVFVPKEFLQTSPENARFTLPVIFYIHGGAFIQGSSTLYSPSFLLDKDVILVTLNYRLGPLGFLTTSTNDAPGNLGLYDQLEALKWVHTHIRDFGGDNFRITMVGQSAGAASANYLMLSPLAKGLFHRVILMSGTAIESWAKSRAPNRNVMELAGAVGCPAAKGLPALVNCMRKVPLHHLIPAFFAISFNERKMGKLDLVRSAPLWQVPSTGIKNPIIPQDPKELLEQNLMPDVPVMLGTTKDEGSYVLAISYLSYLKLNGLERDADYLKNKLIPEYFLKEFLAVNDSANDALSKSLESLYCRGVDLTNFKEAAPCFNDILGVLMFKAGTEEVARLYSAAKKPAYLYSFNFASNFTLLDTIVGHVDFETGVSHADDLMYLFPLVPTADAKLLAMKDKMIEVWANFAKYGDPTPIEQEKSWKALSIPSWSPYNLTSQPYMAMNHEFTMNNNVIISWSSI